MPVSPTYPGIYIQEAPGPPPPIVAAQTNVGVFIGYAHPLKTPQTLLGTAVLINGFTDYQRQFGGFVRSVALTSAYDTQNNPGAFADLALAVNQFFLNGGTQTYVVAVNNSYLASLNAPTVNVHGIVFTAREVTDELFYMTVSVRPNPPSSPGASPLADIVITYGPTAGAPHSPPSSPPVSIATGPATVIETYRRVSLDPANPAFIEKMIGTAQLPISNLVTVAAGSPIGSFPATATTYIFSSYLPGATQFYQAGDFTSVLAENSDLDKVPLAGNPPFNLMVLPGISGLARDPITAATTGDGSGDLILATAIAFCERKFAFLVMDPPPTDSADGSLPGYQNTIGATAGDNALPRSKNAALYFPYLLSPDPSGSPNNIVTGLPNEIPPAATVAGIYAATDLARGVWKAPAGFQATTNNITGVVPRGRMTDLQQGLLNPISVNCLRDFPNIPTVVFGARTLASTYDQQWTYVSVRRMALFLEQTFYANLKWVIFEPNAQPLWTAITQEINAFMLGLFKQGAFQGNTPSDAYKVQCDNQTTTQTDIDLGIVNIVVSFAPLKPAEFVVITIAQLAGQAQTA
jgi:phage tail sheath protein FI